MIEKNEIKSVRNEVMAHVGSRVTIRANKGRKRISVKQGVIESTYPSIFVVKVHNENQNSFRNVSYSYTDLITKNVELCLCSE